MLTTSAPKVVTTKKSSYGFKAKANIPRDVKLSGVTHHSSEITFRANTLPSVNTISEVNPSWFVTSNIIFGLENVFNWNCGTGGFGKEMLIYWYNIKNLIQLVDTRAFLVLCSPVAFILLCAFSFQCELDKWHVKCCDHFLSMANMLHVQSIYFIITQKRSMEQGDVFTGVCLST